MSLSNKSLLAYVKISAWTGRKLDKRATGTVENSYSTKGKVGNYTKKLLPDAKELDAIQSKAGAIRAFFYEQTSPWMSDGGRILSSKNHLAFSSEYRNKKSEFDKAVKEIEGSGLTMETCRNMARVLAVAEAKAQLYANGLKSVHQSMALLVPEGASEGNKDWP